ncbi:MAG: mechanosensitive ion channel [Candidatus Thorarchaeota archaeon]|nr:mechanosensitive ion channel [Candidatus Thorarchaeota archaeon]
MFVEFIASLLQPFGLDPYAQYIAIVPFLIILYIVYLIVARSIRMSFHRAGLPREATTGVIFIVRLIFFGIAVIAALTITEIVAGEGVVAFGALTGTAVGLAFSRSLSNMVSGLYVFASRPFRIGDYIRIGSVEGIVRDITLNYTKIVKPDYTIEAIPNSDIVEEKLVNFRIRIDQYLNLRGMKKEQEITEEGRLSSAMNKFKKLTTGEEIYRYTFEIFAHRAYDVGEARESMRRVVQEWENRFLNPPEMFYSTNDYNGTRFGFAIIVDDPKKILEDGADFQEALVKSFQG